MWVQISWGAQQGITNGLLRNGNAEVWERTGPSTPKSYPLAEHLKELKTSKKLRSYRKVEELQIKKVFKI